MVESAKPLVLITGISGYIGGQILAMFVTGEGAGKYRMRGTVRSLNNHEKLKPLKDSLKSAFDEVELVEADLTDELSIDRAVSGCQYVVHTASPVSTDSTNFEAIIRPAVNGTEFVMKACQKYGVKRVVMTSSRSAIIERPDS